MELDEKMLKCKVSVQSGYRKLKSCVSISFVRYHLTKNQNLVAFCERQIKFSQGFGNGGFDVLNEAKIAKIFLAKAQIARPVIFDGGANVGNYSGAILSYFPNSQIVLFEPSSTARADLEKRFSDNPNIVICKEALSKETGQGILWSDIPGSSLASLTKRDLDHHGIEFVNRESISLITLDDWIQLNGIVPDLIKLDVEGHEMDVLQGAEEILKRVSLVTFEFGGCNIDTRTYFKDFWIFFEDAGFELFRITKDRAVRINEYNESYEYFFPTNYIAVNKLLNLKA